MKQSFYKFMKWNTETRESNSFSSIHSSSIHSNAENEPLPQTELFFPIKSPIQNYEQRIVQSPSVSTLHSTYEHTIELPIESSPPLSPIQLPRTTESYLSLYLHAIYKCAASQLYWCSITLFGK